MKAHQFSAAGRGVVHKLWRAHKPLPQILESEYGWFGAGAANSVNYWDDCTQTVLGAGLAGLDHAGG